MTFSSLHDMIGVARCASRHLTIASTTQKNAALQTLADALRREKNFC